jgi:hypothetical protein
MYHANPHSRPRPRRDSEICRFRMGNLSRPREDYRLVALRRPLSDASRAHLFRYPALFAYSARRTQDLRQFLLNDPLDGARNPLWHQLFHRPFPLRSALAIALRGIVLRHRPPAGVSCGSVHWILTIFHFSNNFRTPLFQGSSRFLGDPQL